MGNRTAVVVATLLIAVAVALLAGAVFVYSGFYDVAASRPHNPLSRWLLQTAMHNSVRAHAKAVGAPPQLGADEVRHAAREFAEMCVACHGAPGVERGDWGKGLTPEPPELAKAVQYWNERELFWIVKQASRQPACRPSARPIRTRFSGRSSLSSSGVPPRPNADEAGTAAGAVFHRRASPTPSTTIAASAAPTIAQRWPFSQSCRLKLSAASEKRPRAR